MAVNVLALDIGASNGRAIIGNYEGGILRLREVHRFSNGYFRMLGGLYWDPIRIHKEILNCLRACKTHNIPIDCIAIDAWSQDYAWIGGDGCVSGLPRCYHDPVLANRAGDFDAVIAPEELYRHCGQVRTDISALRQIYYDSRFRADTFRAARKLLFIPYLLAYQLCGEMGYDCTIPPIGELMDAGTGRISEMLARKIDIQDKIPPYRECGTIFGHTDRSLYEETGYNGIPVACIGAHDTSAAAFAIPAEDEYLYVSSGSFAMYGAVLGKPVLNGAAFDARLCSSPQCDGMTNLLSGTVGMFTFEQCMKSWKARGIAVSYDELNRYALQNENESYFDFSDVDMATPDMPSEIIRALHESGRPAPAAPQDFYVVFANSLAKRLSENILALERVVERKFDKLYMVGGGSQAKAVNARIAKLINQPIMTGLTEAAAAGNALMQLVALGTLKSCAEAKEVAARSFPMQQTDI